MNNSAKLVPDMPDDALVEVQGQGLFVNGTGSPVGPLPDPIVPSDPVEVLPEDAAASESDVAQ